MSETKSDTFPTSMKGLTLIKVRALIKGALRGFATFQYGSVIIHDAPLLQSHGKTWVNLPGKPRVDRDGQPMLDHRGKPAYDPIVAWSSRESGDKVQMALLEAIRATHPAVLDTAE